MLSTNNPRVNTKTLVMSSLCAALLLSACNDSNAEQKTASVAPAVSAASQQDAGVGLVTSAADINQRNHVCFTMDVNNVKCVLGDTVAYVPQPILEEDAAAAEQAIKDQAKNNKKDDKKGSKEDKEAAAAEQEATAQLLANQKALNEARSLVFVAKYCDMERPVVYSKEGVACTFKPHALYDAGAVAEATQYQMNLIAADDFFKEVAAIPGVEKFEDPAFGNHGGYRLFLNRGKTEGAMAIGESTAARILTKRIDREGNVLGFYHEELNFANLNPQMKILTAGLVAGDHVKLVFDTSLQNEQPLWRTSSLEFGQPYIWEVVVQAVGPAQRAPAPAQAPAAAPAQAAPAEAAPAAK